jgi:hypothetical protein
MIECIFTIDYEIYGNGEGSLKELVYEPAKRLKRTFDEAEAKFVLFVEAVELEKIETFRSDPAIGQVKDQIREFHRDRVEIALHLHPQWCNARYENNNWTLDYSEYNLCTLAEQRITKIVSDSIAYLRDVLNAPDFTPLSFRAGNWLVQPTATAALVLAKHGIQVDSSVFKGGRQHKHNLDYRGAIRNGYHWRFEADVAIAQPTGPLLEIPIYTAMVPFWKMATGKRLGLQRKAASRTGTSRWEFDRVLDLMRLRQPLKFDFCRMTLGELVTIIETVLEDDRRTPSLFKPIVAIGHTKDLVDFDTVEAFLSYLNGKKIPISTFRDIYSKCPPVADTIDQCCNIRH